MATSLPWSPRGPDTPETHTDYHGSPVLRLPRQADFFGSETGIGIEAMVMRQRVAKFKRAFQPDLIHVSLPGPSTILHKWTTPSVVNCPTLVSMHVAFTDDEIAGPSWSVRTTTEAQWITTCSNDLLHKTTAALPAIATKASVVHNGLPMPAAQPTPLPFTPPRLFCAGRMVEQKGFEYAIEAMPQSAPAFPRHSADHRGRRRTARELEALRADSRSLTSWTCPAGSRRSAARLDQSIDGRVDALTLGAVRAGGLARSATGAAGGGRGGRWLARSGQRWRNRSPARAVQHQRTGGCGHRGAAPIRSATAAWGEAGRVRARTAFGVQAYADAFEALYHQLVGEPVFAKEEA